jgi:sulfite exporter TauE/SafE
MTGLFGPALAAAFLAGLGGGLHCAGMCGGIVAAMCSPAVGGTPVLRHVFAYNFGRIFSYSVAGALAGAVGAVAALGSAGQVLQPLVLAFASLMLIALGLSLAEITPLVRRLETMGTRLWRRLQPWTSRLLPITSSRRAFALGALWGWLPCGMVYAVLAAALALGNWWQGAMLLMAFGVGTLPNLIALGAFWQKLDAVRRLPALRSIAGCAVVAFGIYGLIKSGHRFAMIGELLSGLRLV